MPHPLPLPPSLPAIKLSVRGRVRPSALRRPAPAAVSRSRSTAADGHALPPSPTAAARWRALPPTFFQSKPTPSRDLRRRAVPPKPLPVAGNTWGKLHRVGPWCWPLFFRRRPLAPHPPPLPSFKPPSRSTNAPVLPSPSILHSVFPKQVPP
jgi:hypothetical protein